MKRSGNERRARIKRGAEMKKGNEKRRTAKIKITLKEFPIPAKAGMEGEREWKRGNKKSKRQKLK